VTELGQWRRCNACKKPIALGALYWVCSVSTCNRKRTGMVFCTVSCWEVHLPVANHREAWAVEKTAPRSAEPEAAAVSPGAKREERAARRVLPGTTPAGPRDRGSSPNEVLIVASRLKDYVKARSGYNTSDRVLEPLSEIVREVVDRALENAEREGRRTLLDRDIPSR